MRLVRNNPTHCAYKGCMAPLCESHLQAQDGKHYCCVLCAQRGMHYDRLRHSVPELQLVPAQQRIP